MGVMLGCLDLEQFLRRTLELHFSMQLLQVVDQSDLLGLYLVHTQRRAYWCSRWTTGREPVLAFSNNNALCLIEHILVHLGSFFP